jgi:hypothetical protein
VWLLVVEDSCQVGDLVCTAGQQLTFSLTGRILRCRMLTVQNRRAYELHAIPLAGDPWPFPPYYLIQVCDSVPGLLSLRKALGCGFLWSEQFVI